MNKIIKILFFAIIIKPIVFVVLGLNLRGKNNLPKSGPAILAANHNSHLDTMVLMSLYPLSKLHKIRPVAAADYFYKNRFLRWFSDSCIDIIPLERKGEAKKEDLFLECHTALDNGDILIIFPKGSRGKPEKMSAIKKGLFYLVKERGDTKITPVLMHGLGNTLPKGEALLVPFNCDVIIGDSLSLSDTATEFVDKMEQAFQRLQQYCITKN